MKLKTFSIFLLILFVNTIIFSQDIDRLYLEGKKMMDDKNFQESIKIIDIFISQYPENIKTKDLVVNFVRKTPMEFFTEKLVYSEFLTEKFPFDSTTNNIRIEIANLLINKKLYFESFKWIYQVYKFSEENVTNKNNALKNIQNLIKGYLNESELEYIYYNYNDDG